MSTDTAEYCWIRLNITKDECILTDIRYSSLISPQTSWRSPSCMHGSRHTSWAKSISSRGSSGNGGKHFFAGLDIFQRMTADFIWRGNMVIPAFGGVYSINVTFCWAIIPSIQPNIPHSYFGIVYSINRWSLKGWMMICPNGPNGICCWAKKTTGDVKRTYDEDTWTDKCRYGGCHSTNYPETTSPLVGPCRKN